MENARISPFQFFCLVFLFELGTAVIIGLGMEAKQDAWIAILIGLTIGIIVLFIYGGLYQHYPNALLTTYTKQVMGKTIGSLISFLYIIYFIYIGARVLRDIATLLQITWLQRTPILVISMVLVLVTIYTIFHGVEVLARTGEIYLFVYLFSTLVTVVFLLFSDVINLQKLLPVAENWRLILKTAFPVISTFPFGEMIAFTMFLPYLNNRKKGFRYGLMAMILAGVLISFTIAMDIASLGGTMVGRSPFPLLTTMGKISVNTFIQRLDILACIILVIGGFFKITIFSYAAIIGSADLFKLSHKKLTLPLATITLLLSIMIAENTSEHFKEGLEIIPYYIHLPMQIGIPIILLCVSLLRKRFSLKKTY
jgi:spore germination protein KB